MALAACLYDAITNIRYGIPGLPRTILYGCATGFALINGIGHLSGVDILVIAPLIPNLVASLGHTSVPIIIFVIIAAFLIVAAIIAQFGVATRQKRLDGVSP